MAAATVVSFDRRSFKLNNAPFLVLSGSVHYIRVHPTRWARLFQTFKDARLNTIETYVFWGHHEPTPSPTATPYDPLPPVTFSGFLDLFAFVSTAHASGLRVILRLGPYVCAEVEYGGLPVRLRDEPGMRFRTWNEPFKNRLEAWVLQVVHKLRERDLLAGQGGPVIAVQLENEYSMVSHAYGDDGIRYIQWVSDLQRRLDLGVPAIMCYGAADGVVETINSFYAHEEVAQHRAAHPDQPPVWTECWTGWYDVWGAPHHVRPVKDLVYAAARFFAAGGAGINYYMWMGGTNVGRASTMYLQTSSYDYDAPINELYRHTIKSRCLTALHAVLLDRFESVFNRVRDTDPEAIIFTPIDDDESVKITTFDWGDLLFLCNDEQNQTVDCATSLVLPHNILYDVSATPLKPRSVHIVDTKTGKCIFDTDADCDRIAAARGGSESVGDGVEGTTTTTTPSTATEATSTTITTNTAATEPTFDVVAVGSKWTSRTEAVPTLKYIAKLLCRQAVPDASQRLRSDDARPVVVDLDKPKELVALTHGSSDYAFYVARFAVDRHGGACTMEFDAADYAQVFVDGVLKGATALPLWEDRWSNRWNKYDDGGPGCHVCVEMVLEKEETHSDGSEDIKAKHREIEVCVMVSSLGMVKGDWQLGERNMLEEIKGLLSDVTIRSRDVVATGNDGADSARWTGRRISPWHSVGKLDGEVKQWGHPHVLSKYNAEDSVPMNRDGNDGSESASKQEEVSMKNEEDRLSAPAWFACELQVPCTSHAWMLDLSAVGKGMLFVNGVMLGRFWDIAGTRPRNGFLEDSPIVQVCGSGSGSGSSARVEDGDAMTEVEEEQEKKRDEDDDDGDDGDDDNNQQEQQKSQPTQRFYHVPAWLAAQNAGAEAVGNGDGKIRLHIVLMVERGPLPVERLVLLEALDDDDKDIDDGD